ncbi:hypothetical protein BJV74DRAFT_799783 [Russula compacta]|nr:hypothetical protein BJV74DRAFT_799783 [Russula compacta]
MSTVHYTNNHQWDLAVAAELYESLPSNLQNMLKDELHRKSFINMLLIGVLHGKSAINAKPIGPSRQPDKATIWGIMKTTPGMITLTAMVLTFICRLDQTFSERTIGITGLNWRDCFSNYKWMILHLPPWYYKQLVLWYNARLFGTSDGEEVTHDSAMDEPSYSNVNDLIQYLESAPREASSEMPALPLPLSASEEAPSAMPALPLPLGTSEEAPSATPVLPPPCNPIPFHPTPIINPSLFDSNADANDMALDMDAEVAPSAVAATGMRWVRKSQKLKEPVWPLPGCMMRKSK